MGIAVGVDLGTTTSMIACYDGSRQRIPTSEASFAIPSAVTFLDDGAALIGTRSPRRAPAATVRSAKRFLGRSFADASRAGDVGAGDIVAAADGAVRFAVHGQRMAPEEVCAQTLGALLGEVGRRLGEPVSELVITVPAFFDDAQRRATREVARLAGVEVLRIMNEPTAAALAHGLDRTGHETIMVFDLGAGGLDIAVVDVGYGIVEVRSVAGDAHLGGDDFDRAVADHLARELAGSPPRSPGPDPDGWRRLAVAAEKAKIRLSSVSRTRVSVAPDRRGAGRPSTTLSRDTVDGLTAHLVERCRQTAHRALVDAGLVAGELDEVVVVGRAARMPAVREMVRSLTGGRPPSAPAGRDDLVAHGAAVQAAVHAGAICDALVWDVTPVALSVRMPDGRESVIVRRNTATPVTHTVVVPDHGEPGGDIVIVAGEDGRARTLGRVPMDAIPAGQRGRGVMFHVDADGILTASTSHPDSGLEVPVAILNGNHPGRSRRPGAHRDALLVGPTDV